MLDLTVLLFKFSVYKRKRQEIAPNLTFFLESLRTGILWKDTFTLFQTNDMNLTRNGYPTRLNLSYLISTSHAQAQFATIDSNATVTYDILRHLKVYKFILMTHSHMIFLGI